MLIKPLGDHTHSVDGGIRILKCTPPPRAGKKCCGIEWRWSLRVPESWALPSEDTERPSWHDENVLHWWNYACTENSLDLMRVSLCAETKIKKWFICRYYASSLDSNLMPVVSVLLDSQAAFYSPNLISQLVTSLSLIMIKMTLYWSFLFSYPILPSITHT